MIFTKRTVENTLVIDAETDERVAIILNDRKMVLDNSDMVYLWDLMNFYFRNLSLRDKDQGTVRRIQLAKAVSYLAPLFASMLDYTQSED